MKNTIVRTLVTLGLSAVLSPVALLAQGPIHATIPFEFTVGSKSFHAGDYSVKQISEGVLLIQSRTGGAGVITMVLPSEKTAMAGNPVLTFNKYGSSYFLAKVSCDDRGWKLNKSRLEKEMIAQATSPKPVIVAAAVQTK